MTRSFTYMGHGQFWDAFRLHRLGPVGVELAAEILTCAAPRVRSAVRKVILTDMAREVCPTLPR